MNEREAVINTVESGARKKLKRDLRREALTRLEDAARTVADFENVVAEWNKLDENEERRVHDNEVGRPDEEMLHWTEGEDGELRTELNTVVPRPLEHEWWRQIIRGDFLDLIFDCPQTLHELTSSHPVHDLVKGLRENQKEVLYLRAIRQYSPQKIAVLRGQTDRNIRKVYTTLIAGLREKLYERLAPRVKAGFPVTLRQQKFVFDYRAERGRKKATLDGGDDE